MLGDDQNGYVKRGGGGVVGERISGNLFGSVAKPQVHVGTDVPACLN